MKVNYKSKLMISRLASILLLAGTTAAFFGWNFVHLRQSDNNDGSSGSLNEPDHSVIPGQEEDDSDYFIKIETPSSLNVDELVNSLKKTESVNIRGVYDTSHISSSGTELRDSLSLASEGYYTTSMPYDSSTMQLSVMKNVMTIDNIFSLRNKTVQKVSYVQEHDYAEFKAVYTDTEVQRPLVELYMGYIFVDNGTTLDIYSKNGAYINSFDDAYFVPAYTRDVNGNPLFYRINTAECKPYSGEILERDPDGTRVREPHEKDKTVWVEAILKNKGEGTPSVEDVTEYYRLVGGSFSRAEEYNDLTYGRGLYFDYPIYYGTSDNSLYITAKTFDTYSQSIDGALTAEHSVKWTYASDGHEISDYIYDRAFNFSEGLGCVSTEKYYQDGGMFFLRSNGTRAFNTVRKYNNTALERYVIENLLPPLSYGPESIGYFYYDHGLVRARLEVIDYWNYNSNNVIRLNSSTEVLIDAGGKVFPIPVGYEVKGYSDGMILLEKNGLYGFMDYTGAWVAEPVYSYAEAFSEGLAVLATADGRYGMIDTDGNIVLPFSYKHISSVSDGIIAAYDDEGWSIIRKMTA